MQEKNRNEYNGIFGQNCITIINYIVKIITYVYFSIHFAGYYKVVTLKLTEVSLQKKTINLNFLKSLALNRNYK